MTQRGLPPAASAKSAFASATTTKLIRRSERFALNEFIQSRLSVPCLSIIRPQRNRKFADLEGLLDLQIRSGPVIRQPANLSCLQCGEGQAIVEQNAIAGQRGNAWTGCEDALKVQSVSGAESDQL